MNNGCDMGEILYFVTVKISRMNSWHGASGWSSNFKAFQK